MYINLTQLKERERARIVGVCGGEGFVRKLDASGIRVGVEIIKISSQFMRGPIVIKAGSTQIAVGYGMARKIMVEIQQ